MPAFSPITPWLHRVQRVALLGLVVAADRGARLDRVDDHAGVEELELDLVRRRAANAASTFSLSP